MSSSNGSLIYDMYTELIKLYEQTNQVYMLINAIDDVMLDISITETNEQLRYSKLLLLDRNRRDHEIEGFLLLGKVACAQNELLQVYERYFF